MKDLIVQGPALTADALAAFKVVCTPARIRVQGHAARCAQVPDDAETRRAARALADYWKLDIAFIDSGLKLADFRLLAMDMDSTLINIESLDEVAALAGKGREVAQITEAAMRGEIADYKESLRQRVAMLAGIDAELLGRVAESRLKLNPGAETLVRACQAAGLRTLLATGGFSYFTRLMQQRLGFDFVCSNELVIADGRLTGAVTGPAGGDIIDADGKAQALRDACATIGCPTSQAIAIGDGANDLKMLKLAGLSVAYRAKPIVREQATVGLDHATLSGVLALF